jgi:hypothetical protein
MGLGLIVLATIAGLDIPADFGTTPESGTGNSG